MNNGSGYSYGARVVTKNVDGQNETTVPSLGQQEQVGYEYPPEPLPKAPDKRDQHVNRQQDNEVHVAPQPQSRGRAGG